MSPSPGKSTLRLWGRRAALMVALLPCAAFAQVLTVDSSGRITNGKSPAGSAPVDRRYKQVEPTHVKLSETSLDGKTKLELERYLEAEQGFAMRPLPCGHKGLTLKANGKVEPAGEGWLEMATQNGISTKPGARVVVTNVKIDHNRMIFDLNGGPDLKHRFLRHIEVGMGDGISPVVQNSGQQATGARITLVFDKRIPEMTGTEVEDLLSPLISFRVKTPVEAYTDTLPPLLKNAILSHHVLVGMDTDMVLYALGRPRTKDREMVGQMPVEIWIYGQPPKPVQFVRFNGDRVIRLEIADVGKPLQVFTKDEVSGLMRTDGTPALASSTRTVRMGDVSYNPDTQAAPAPPSLRKPGEKLPDLTPDTGYEMKPVRFPKQADSTGTAQNQKQTSSQANTGKAKPSQTTVAPANSAPAQPAQQPSAQTNAQSAPQTN